MRRGRKPGAAGSFLDDVKRSAQEVGREARRYVQGGRLRLEINALEGKMGESIYELGERCLELHQRNELHHFELDDIFADLSELRRETEEKQKLLEELTHRRAKDEEEDFGYVVGDDEEGLPTEKRFCPECGSKVRSSARFCSQCGARM
jgi:ribosomal protein S27AE